MSQTSQDKPDGNTKTSGPKYQLYRWVFTLSCEKMTTLELWDILSQKAKEFTFSKESGIKTGYEHYQGCFSLHNKEYFNTVKNWIGNTVHLEPCKDWHASKNYCSKSDTHVEGPYSESRKPLRTICILRPWQEKLKQMLEKEPNNRDILWICDKKGGIGKTQFCKWAAYNMGATIITNGGVKDISILIPNNPKIIIFNFSRSKENYISYEGIEGVKDGLITSTKYESKTKIFDSPHVVIMANFEPDYDALSEDRWKVISF